MIVERKKETKERKKWKQKEGKDVKLHMKGKSATQTLERKLWDKKRIR